MVKKKKTDSKIRKNINIISTLKTLKRNDEKKSGGERPSNKNEKEARREKGVGGLYSFSFVRFWEGGW